MEQVQQPNYFMLFMQNLQDATKLKYDKEQRVEDRALQKTQLEETARHNKSVEELNKTQMDKEFLMRSMDYALNQENARFNQYINVEKLKAEQDYNKSMIGIKNRELGLASDQFKYNKYITGKEMETVALGAYAANIDASNKIRQDHPYTEFGTYDFEINGKTLTFNLPKLGQSSRIFTVGNESYKSDISNKLSRQPYPRPYNYPWGLAFQQYPTYNPYDVGGK